MGEISIKINYCLDFFHSLTGMQGLQVTSSILLFLKPKMIDLSLHGMEKSRPQSRENLRGEKST